MRTTFKSLIVAVTLLALSSLSFAADQIDNPAYKAWSKFKAGTSVTIKMSADMGGMKSDIETTTTLLEITPEKAVIENKSTMNMGGNKMDMPAQKTDVPAKIDAPPATAAGTTKPEVKESTEEVAVQDKKIKCKVVETKTANMTSKMWTSDEVPGGLVKSETSMTGQGTATQMITAMTIK